MMKVLLQDYMASSSYGLPTYDAILFYMAGTIPTSSTLASIVDMTSMSDLQSKCIGATMVTGTTSRNATSFAYLTSFTQKAAAYSWLKGGNIAISGYYIYPPARSYYTNGRANTMSNMPPHLFAMPYDCMTNTQSLNACLAYRDPLLTPAYAAYASGSEVQFTLEYDASTTISAIRVAQGSAISAFVQDCKVEYWNSSTSLWVTALSAANSAVLSASSVNTLTFTAVSSTKFRITLYPSACVSGYNLLNLTGIALMHTATVASTSITSTLTYGILIPMPSSSAGFWSQPDGVTNLNPALVSDVVNSNMLETANLQCIGSKISTYVPFIVDVVGTGSAGSKMWISKASALTTLDHPTLTSFVYKSGDL